MFRILIVEDDNSKASQIVDALCACKQLTKENCEVVGSLMDARLALEGVRYDLLILDIALPIRKGQAVVHDAGVQLVHELSSRMKYRVPSRVLGITGLTDGFSGVREALNAQGVVLVKYDVTSEAWAQELAAAVTHELRADEERRRATGGYDCFLGIVCALRDPELQAIQRLPWNWTEAASGRHGVRYFEGSMTPDRTLGRVCAISSPRMGMAAAAVATMNLIHMVRPRIVVMAGIAGGAPDSTNFGDVLAADPSWDYGAGKRVVRNGASSFEAAPHQLSLSPLMRRAVEAVSANDAALSAIRANWPGESPSSNPRVLTGPVACGASVVADPEVAREVRAQHRKLVGLDMETYGVYSAVDECSGPRPLAVSLKAVVDHVDSSKSDRWQRYGAYTSANVTRLVAEYLLRECTA